MQLAHASSGMECVCGGELWDFVYYLFSILFFFFHLNIIERLMMTASREEKPKGCLM